ncbi:phosphotransferase enzyme family protein [Jiella sonneratiae]|uniref:Phosphotransferase n=1 Tax=Jiella sonneratiae TaxID=2816856 RepID=A0ABS3IZP5_9HYPH|nr:phosphotransferase [Jiella sonneratiae]MBO0902883.1 phosphotransferase [Jiella sonneratiae]
MYDETFLKRLETGLVRMLPAWGLEPGTQLRLLTISENATFLARDPAGGRLVIRVHRPHYHSRAEILSELAWMASLIEGDVVETPRPVAARDGRLLLDLDDGGELRHVVAFEFMSGEEPKASGDLVRWFFRLGAITARLHGHARSWRPPADFSRKVWDFDAMLGDRPLWGDWRAAIGLDPADRPVLERTAEALRSRLEAYGMGEGRFGLVHADLRLANLLVDGERLGVIDFDDCGFSWFAYDFAAAISFIETDPIVPELMSAWIAGYRTVAPFGDQDAAMLPVFVMLRRMLLTAWLASHAETPTAQELGPTYTEGTLRLARAFLDRPQ